MNTKDTELIAQNIARDMENPENYLKLADHYLDSNPDLAYLSLQNASFFSESEKKDLIDATIKELYNSGIVRVNPVSFIITSSGNLDHLKGTLESIRITCSPDSYEILVVGRCSDSEIEYLSKQKDVKVLNDTEDCKMAGYINRGIREASEGFDIFWINAGNILLPNSLYCLRMALYDNDEVGAVSPVGHSFFEASIRDLRECMDYAMRVNVPSSEKCERTVWPWNSHLLIKNEAIMKIGFQDEIFHSDKFRTDDVCLRVLENGNFIEVCHNSLIYEIVDGQKNNNPVWDYLEREDEKNFKEKWGVSVNYYSNTGDTLMQFIMKDHPDHQDEFSVLECGCGVGTANLHLKYLYPNVRIYGIEIVEKAARIGKMNCNIRQGNVEKISPDELEEKMDYIIFGDVIEHLIDPYGMVRKCHDMLKKGGKILASIPNIMHYSVIIPLLKGSFVFEDAGIRDYTHLHNWTLDNICSMFDECDYEIEEMRFTMVDTDDWKELIREEDKKWFIPILESDETAPEQQFRAYQYLVCARSKL